MKNQYISIRLLWIAFLFLGCEQIEKGSLNHISQATKAIDDLRLLNADQTPEDWLSYGRNYAEERYSTLDQINHSNLNQLGLAWSLNLNNRRGIEATPIVVDGIMYVTGPWSLVYAIDARKGTLIWKYDPKVPKQAGKVACCDVVNRGVALYKGMVYLGTLDGRLIALDAANGHPIWEVMTVDSNKPYTMTGAPRIVKGNVIIGNGGAEYGVRGYVTAYDAMTGAQEWRFYTVPGNPNLPFESKAMEIAAKTWTGEWWKYGGGGTVWDAMAFDPELNQLYIGVGNGAPWNQLHRSPEGGDNLYLSSIVSLNPDDGTLNWHYQTTPGDTWDYTATQHLILTDLEIDNQERKVIMQAPKNGFFYVLDRVDGAFISAAPYVYVNWAKGIDSKTGRPIESEFSRYADRDADIYPSIFGGHNWQPMAYNPKTNLVYIPARERKTRSGHNPNWEFQPNQFNSGRGTNNEQPALVDTLVADRQGKLIAWDPVQQNEVWRVDQDADWNGGVLTTATGLVFTGTAQGKLMAYDATDGQTLWEVELGTGIIAPPITYSVDGEQYLSIAVGWGGVVGLYEQYTDEIYPGTIYTFALDKNSPFPNYPKSPKKEVANFAYNDDEIVLQKGAQLYWENCGKCHGEIAREKGGALPDLGYINENVYQNFESIVLDGLFLGKGMPSFKEQFTAKEVLHIRDYVMSVAKKKTPMEL